MVFRTVDGRNPKQPPGMYKTLQLLGKTTDQLVQDFFHEQCHMVVKNGDESHGLMVV